MSNPNSFNEPPAKALEAFKNRDLESFRNIVLDPLQCMPVIFEEVLRTPGSAEFIKACIEKGALIQVILILYVKS